MRVEHTQFESMLTYLLTAILIFLGLELAYVKSVYTTSDPSVDTLASL